MRHKEPWFKLWATDYLTDPDVDELSLEAQGLLLRMWCVCSQRGNIPDDPEEIARLTRCKLQSVSHCHSQCKRFFKSRNGLLYSERMEREKAKSEQARANAGRRYRKETYAPAYANGSANGSANGNAKSPTQKAREPESRKAESQRPENPSRAKRERASDERHTTFKAAIKDYWNAKNPDIDMPWGGAEGKALSTWLREAPHVTIEQFTTLLQARFQSEVNHGDRPSQWIRWVTKYGDGPIDRFGKSIAKENSNGASRPSVTKQRVDNNRRALAEALAKRGIRGPWDSPGTHRPEVPEPRPDNDAGRVHGGSGTASAEILPPESRGRDSGPEN
jgi:uncharacterized protein YdaU (DUF1376 family)